ncbi:hypothetical protein OLP50_02980, partial [Campylobacter jejuni]|nr:hypothetical protein [Campylobacter jejuni]
KEHQEEIRKILTQKAFNFYESFLITYTA